MDESIAGASYVQRAMWAAAQRFRGAPLNVMMIPWRVRGHIDVRSLELALADVVARHATLRSCLRYEQATLFQLSSAPTSPVDFTLSDAPAIGTTQALNSTLAALRLEALEGIDPGGTRTFKARLVRLGERDHLLCMFVHHAMCDAWSSEIIIRDLTEYYRARLQGETAALSAIRQQYSDYARDQVDTFNAGGYAAEISYWRKQLEALPPALELRADWPRKGNRDLTARSHHVVADLQMLDALKHVARTLRVSLFSVLLAAVAALLHVRTGARDMLIGVSTVNRWTPASREFVGCATSLLPARLQPTPEKTLAALAVRTHQTVRELLAYGRIPLELVLREAQGALLRGPGFPVWAQYRESAQPLVLSAEGLSLSPLTIERAAVLCEIEFDLCGTPDSIECELAHRAALFSPATIGALADDFRSMLHLIATDAERPIGRFEDRR